MCTCCATTARSRRLCCWKTWAPPGCRLFCAKLRASRLQPPSSASCTSAQPCLLHALQLVVGKLGQLCQVHPRGL